ncbi:MAG: class I SAM-dependent methyltransferase [Deltaproteobacteria bacterium]|nr:class I SAM-dependent methyltransferase [Deltaproteobacteria bacterium]
MRTCSACGQALTGAAWHCDGCGWRAAERGGFACLAPELAAGNDGYDASLFRASAALQAQNFWFVGRNRLLAQQLGKLQLNPARLLEIGCGTGFVLKMLGQVYPEAELWGSDIYTEGLDFAAEAVPRAHLLQMDATTLPFRDEFDLIGAFDVIEHIDDDRQALAAMAAALRPHGHLVLTVPQHPALWSRMDEYAHHKRRYTRPELLEKVRESGLQVRSATSFVSLLAPAMWASRVLQRNRPPVADGIDPDLRMNPSLNRVLLSVMELERGLVARGLDLPVGGSLLLVAQRA